MFISLRESGATGFKKWSVSLQPKQIGNENATGENSLVTSGPNADPLGVPAVSSYPAVAAIGHHRHVS
jgi:hypothetical protein